MGDTKCYKHFKWQEREAQKGTKRNNLGQVVYMASVLAELEKFSPPWPVQHECTNVPIFQVCLSTTAFCWTIWLQDILECYISKATFHLGDNSTRKAINKRKQPKSGKPSLSAHNWRDKSFHAGVKRHPIVGTVVQQFRFGQEGRPLCVQHNSTELCEEEQWKKKYRNTTLCTHLVAYTRALHIHTVGLWTRAEPNRSSPTCTLGREQSIGAFVKSTLTRDHAIPRNDLRVVKCGGSLLCHPWDANPRSHKT